MSSKEDNRVMDVLPMQAHFDDPISYLMRHWMQDIRQRGLTVFAALLAVSGGQKERISCTYGEVGKLSDCSDSTLRRALHDLATYHIITIVRRFNDDCGDFHNLYEINDPDEWCRSADPDGGIWVEVEGGERVKVCRNKGRPSLRNTPPVKSDNPVNNEKVESTNPVNHVDVESTNPSEIDATRVSEPDEAGLAGLVDSTDSHVCARGSNNNITTTTTTTTSFSFNSGSRDQEVDPTSLTLTSGSGSTRRVPRARVTEPAKDEGPRLPSRSDGDFAKAVRFWQRNCGQVGDAVENVLWGFYVKFGAKLLLESLITAVTENKFGNKPSMRFVEVILTRRQTEEINDVARAATLRSSVPPPGYVHQPDLIDQIREQFKAREEAERQAAVALGDTQGKPEQEVTRGEE